MKCQDATVKAVHEQRKLRTKSQHLYVFVYFVCIYIHTHKYFSTCIYLKGTNKHYSFTLSGFSQCLADELSPHPCNYCFPGALWPKAWLPLRSNFFLGKLAKHNRSYGYKLWTPIMFPCFLLPQKKFFLKQGYISSKWSWNQRKYGFTYSSNLQIMSRQNNDPPTMPKS